MNRTDGTESGIEFVNSGNLAKAVEDSLARFDAHKRAEEAEEKAKSRLKERLNTRVSVATVLVATLVSFLTFVRAECADASGGAINDATQARENEESAWALYQAREADRIGYVLADDTLVRETTVLTDNDPRMHLAEGQHAEYSARIAGYDSANRHVFFGIQHLVRRQVLKRREATRINLHVSEYDKATRVLALAIVLFSLTVLARKEALFWIASSLALIGAALAVNGYFLFV